jgi:hypothetical protein
VEIGGQYCGGQHVLTVANLLSLMNIAASQQQICAVRAFRISLLLDLHYLLNIVKYVQP